MQLIKIAKLHRKLQFAEYYLKSLGVADESWEELGKEAQALGAYQATLGIAQMYITSVHKRVKISRKGPQQKIEIPEENPVMPYITKLNSVVTQRPPNIHVVSQVIEELAPYYSLPYFKKLWKREKSHTSSLIKLLAAQLTTEQKDLLRKPNFIEYHETLSSLAKQKGTLMAIEDVVDNLYNNVKAKSKQPAPILEHPVTCPGNSSSVYFASVTTDVDKWFEACGFNKKEDKI